MATAYNVHQALFRGKGADRQLVPDPGDGGEIKVGVTDLAFCVVTGGTTRTIESPETSKIGLGTRLVVNSQTTTITVDGVALIDGDAAEWVVILDSSALRVWSQVA